MAGRTMTLVRRCLPVLACAGALALAFAPITTDATPAFSVVTSTSCPSGAVCTGSVELTPALSTTDAAVQCSAAVLPTIAARVTSTGVSCGLQGRSDGIFYFSSSHWSPNAVPATLTGLATGLPIQQYWICVAGAYQLNDGSVVYGAPVCNVGATVPAPKPLGQ